MCSTLHSFIHFFYSTNFWFAFKLICFYSCWVNIVLSIFIFIHWTGLYKYIPVIISLPLLSVIVALAIYTSLLNRLVTAFLCSSIYPVSAKFAKPSFLIKISIKHLKTDNFFSWTKIESIGMIWSRKIISVEEIIGLP